MTIHGLYAAARGYKRKLNWIGMSGNFKAGPQTLLSNSSFPPASSMHVFFFCPRESKKCQSIHENVIKFQKIQITSSDNLYNRKREKLEKERNLVSHNQGHIPAALFDRHSVRRASPEVE